MTTLTDLAASNRLGRAISALADTLDTDPPGTETLTARWRELDAAREDVYLAALDSDSEALLAAAEAEDIAWGHLTTAATPEASPARFLPGRFERTPLRRALTADATGWMTLASQAGA